MRYDDVMLRKNWTVKSFERLDSFLRRELPLVLDCTVSNSKVRRFIIAGSVNANGRQCRIPSFKLKPGTCVSVCIDEDKLFFEKKPDDIDFTLTDKDVLFEDDYIIVVNKPAFLPTEDTIVEGRKNMHGAVVEYLWKKNPSLRNPPYAGIMHRLDRETSGVLLFTKTRSVNAAVHDMFEMHTARKTYRAVCTCNANRSDMMKEGNSFTVDNFIGRISPKSQACKVGVLDESRGGQHARTEFYIASRKDGLYYIDCHLLTGRTHQIRVHLSQFGLPIVGDKLYGGAEGFASLGNRIMLHAFSLEFPHPVTKELMTVTSELPVEFK